MTGYRNRVTISPRLKVIGTKSILKRAATTCYMGLFSSLIMDGSTDSGGQMSAWDRFSNTLFHTLKFGIIRERAPHILATLELPKAISRNWIYALGLQNTRTTESHHTKSGSTFASRVAIQSDDVIMMTFLHSESGSQCCRKRKICGTE